MLIGRAVTAATDSNRGHLAKRIEHAAVVIGRLRGGAIPRGIGRDAQDEKVAGVEADINPSQLRKRPGQQPGADEQHHGGRNLGDHQSRAQPAGRAAPTRRPRL